ncbi:MAG: TIM-barrel domain-containing protein [Candidatus Acidiferrales bacterium]
MLKVKSLRTAIVPASLLVFLAILTNPRNAGATTESPDQFDPVADPHAVVTVGHARFTILTPELIRMEWAADGKFEDHASLVFLNRKLPVPKFNQTVESMGAASEVIIQTSALTLKYKTVSGADGKFTSDNLSITFKLGGKDVIWNPGVQDTGNLLGTARTLDGVRGSNTKLEPGLVSRDGWTLVDDSMRPLFDSDDFSFAQGEKSPWPWVMERPPGDRQDWYFFGYGHDYRRALYDFTRVAGKIPLPPQFAFGAWWSRYWSYTDQEFKQLVQQFQSHQVPLDVLVIDMDWHPTFGMHWWDKRTDASGHSLGWTGYSWNKILFPDPPAFLSYVHEQGLKATLNMHPASGVQPWEDRYPEMARAMGIDPTTKQYVPFDITNKKFATNYMNILHHPLERQGIDFFWLDWQQESDTKLENVNPTWWLNYVHFTDQEREGKRPLLFHRWGGLGNHRYEIGFSGDTISVWDSLAFQPYFTATAANVGYAYWSHDIGGHMPGTIEPELYLRWIQFGVFSPILRTHTTKNPDSERRIWAYPEPYSDLMRKAFLVRYALQPYIYTEARRTYDTGVAFVHPLYYDSPEAPEAYKAKDEYMFGDSILVAPISQATDKDSQLVKRTVWLPEGNWIEWDTGAHLKGPASTERTFSIRQIPLYVKAGSIIPMQPQMSYTGEKPVDPLILTVFPSEGGQSSTYRLYQDAGNTLGYKHGEEAWTKVRAAWSPDGAAFTLTVSPIEGHYNGMRASRAYELRLRGSWPPESVSVNGQNIAHSENAPGWSYDGSTLTTVVRTHPISTASLVTVAVKVKPSMARQIALLDGFPGKMTRLREAYDILNATWPEGWAPDGLIDAMQTADRIGDHPETAFDELNNLPGKIAALPKEITGMHALEESSEFRTAVAANQFGQPGKPAEEIIKRYHTLVDLGLVHLADILPPHRPQ